MKISAKEVELATELFKTRRLTDHMNTNEKQVKECLIAAITFGSILRDISDLSIEDALIYLNRK